MYYDIIMLLHQNNKELQKHLFAFTANGDIMFLFHAGENNELLCTSFIFGNVTPV